MALSKGVFPLQGVLGAVKGHIICGSFTGANGSISASVGHGFTAAYTGEGVYTITLGQSIKRAVAMLVSGGGTGDKSITISETSAGTVYTIRSFIANTGVADDVIGQVSFLIIADESSSPVR